MSQDLDNGLVVGVADMVIGTAYDPIAQVGALLHFMLPQPSVQSGTKDLKQFMYATTGIPIMFRRLTERGATQSRLILTAAGGSEILEGAAQMAIGKRNRTMMRKVLWKMNLSLAAEDTGGSVARTMSLDVVTGEVRIRSRDANATLWQPAAGQLSKGN